jgi:membrane-bound serine protease (ClpP class)
MILRALLACLFFTSVVAMAQDKKLVYKFDIKQEIGPPAWRNTQKAVAEAERLGADYLLIHMNTYGGLVDMADSIRTRLLNAKPTVMVFIDNNAASAGALISIACDSIYMRKSASIGAATVVNQTGEVVPDKYQSYMRSTMRATAQSTGRDPKIAEAMVDPSVYIPGIIDSGKVLTFTSAEAIQHGFCNGEAESIEEVLTLAGIVNYELVTQQLSGTDRIINWLINPAISGILILIIIGGIYFELQSPGIGFPLAASVLAAIVYFAPLYLEGLAANWEILLFIAGVVLLMAEIFVIPGFGVAGLSGISLMLFALISSLVENDGFDFEIATPGSTTVLEAMVTVLIPFAAVLTASLFWGGKLLEKGPLRRLVLNSTQSKDEGYVIADQQHHAIGARGTALTSLRPIGKVEINGEVFEAKARFGWIDQGAAIQVSGQERFYLQVEVPHATEQSGNEMQENT